MAASSDQQPPTPTCSGKAQGTAATTERPSGAISDILGVAQRQGVAGRDTSNNREADCVDPSANMVSLQRGLEHSSYAPVLQRAVGCAVGTVEQSEMAGPTSAARCRIHCIGCDPGIGSYFRMRRPCFFPFPLWHYAPPGCRIACWLAIHWLVS